MSCGYCLAITKQWYNNIMKYHTMKPFNMTDVAEACGCSVRTLQYYCRAHNINPKRLSLTELVDFIQSYRTNKQHVPTTQETKDGKADQENDGTDHEGLGPLEVQGTSQL